MAWVLARLEFPGRKLCYRILLIGHRGHVEVEGTLGHAPDRMLLVETVEDVEALDLPADERIAVVTQTTLSVDDTREVIEAIQRRFPSARTPKKKLSLERSFIV